MTRCPCMPCIAAQPRHNRRRYELWTKIPFAIKSMKLLKSNIEYMRSLTRIPIAAMPWWSLSCRVWRLLFILSALAQQLHSSIPGIRHCIPYWKSLLPWHHLIHACGKWICFWKSILNILEKQIYADFSTMKYVIILYYIVPPGKRLSVHIRKLTRHINMSSNTKWCNIML